MEGNATVDVDFAQRRARLRLRASSVNLSSALPLLARRPSISTALRPIDTNIQKHSTRALVAAEKIKSASTATTPTANAMSVLSDRQKDELHRSLLDYLHSAGLHASYDALRTELKLDDFVPDPKARHAGLLEKKWGSVIRLQKKIMELETRNAGLQEELASAPAASSRRSTSQADWIPRAPARHVLTGHRQSVTRVAFHPVYNQLVSASDDSTVKIWDWESGDFERTLKGHTKSVQDVGFDSTGNWLVTCASDLTIKLWDGSNEYKNTKTLTGHDHVVSMAQFMPGDDFIVSASRDKTIKVWNVAQGYCIKTFRGHEDWVRSVLPTEDGRLLVSCAKEGCRIWDAASGETKMELRGHDNAVETAIFAPIASYAAIREFAGLSGPAPKTPGAYVASGARDKTIKLWDTASGQCLRTLHGHNNWVRALVFHPDGHMLLSAADDYAIRVWDLKTGRCAKVIEAAHSHFVQCMAWGRKKVSGEGEERRVNVVATGSVDLSVKVWMP